MIFSLLQKGWFEPMAQLVKDDPKIMVMPKVGVIDLDTFEVSIYPLQGKVEVQGFDFFLGQVRTSVRDDYLRSRRTREGPTLVGVKMVDKMVYFLQCFAFWWFVIFFNSIVNLFPIQITASLHVHVLGSFHLWFSNALCRLLYARCL